MTTIPAIHCPECGAITRRETQDDGDKVLICTDDDCPRIIVLSRSYAPVAKPDLDDYTGFAR